MQLDLTDEEREALTIFLRARIAAESSLAQAGAHTGYSGEARADETGGGPAAATGRPEGRGKAPAAEVMYAASPRLTRVANVGAPNRHLMPLTH